MRKAHSNFRRCDVFTLPITQTTLYGHLAKNGHSKAFISLTCPFTGLNERESYSSYGLILCSNLRGCVHIDGRLVGRLRLRVWVRPGPRAPGLPAHECKTAIHFTETSPRTRGKSFSTVFTV